MQEFYPTPAVLEVTDEIRAKLDTPIETLGLDTRFQNALMHNVNRVRGESLYPHHAEISFVGDLIQLTEHDLLITKEISKTYVSRLKEALGKMGLTLNMAPNSWSRPTK